jgi:GNAT superfamily N-acetyltransferase
LYVGHLGDSPAGVTLTVYTDVVGIYAVATPASFRKRGVGTALLSAALEHATERGCATATLQVVAGSYAEALYTKLGFAPRFTSEIWERESR